MEDMGTAVAYVHSKLCGLRTVVLQGRGKHFCVGANHYHEPGVENLHSLARSTFERLLRPPARAPSLVRWP